MAGQGQVQRLTLLQMLGTPLPQIRYRASVVSSNATTDSSYRVEPAGGFHVWSGFAQEVINHVATTALAGDSGAIFIPPPSDFGEITNEEGVRANVYGHWTNTIAAMGAELVRRNPAALRPLALGHHDAAVLRNRGQPDFIIFEEAPTPQQCRCMVNVEAKKDLVLPTAEICGEAQQQDGHMRRIFSQICGYIKMNSPTQGFGYGLVTTFQSSYFCKLTTSESLYISDPILATLVAPSGIHGALWYLLHLLYTVPNPESPALPVGGVRVRKRPQHSVPPRGKSQRLSRKRLKTYTQQACDVAGIPFNRVESSIEMTLDDGDIDFGLRFMCGTHFSFHKGHFKGSRAVLKVIDMVKQPENFRLALHEILFYDKLSHLQGTSIPEFLGAGFYMDGFLFVYAMADIDGVSIDLDKEQLNKKSVLKKASDALITLHDAGCAHGEIELHNIICAPDGSVMLIDLKKARDLTSDRHAEVVLSLEKSKMKGLKASARR